MPFKSSIKYGGSGSKRSAMSSFADWGTPGAVINAANQPAAIPAQAPTPPGGNPPGQTPTPPPTNPFPSVVTMPGYQSPFMTVGNYGSRLPAPTPAATPQSSPQTNPSSPTNPFPGYAQIAQWPSYGGPAAPSTTAPSSTTPQSSPPTNPLSGLPVNNPAQNQRSALWPFNLDPFQTSPYGSGPAAPPAWTDLFGSPG
jgi:hypothetical protein